MARLNIQHDVTLEDVVHIVAIHVNDVAASLDEVALSRKTIEAMVRDELKSHGWQRSWFVGDYVSDDFIGATRDRVIEVYPEAVPDRPEEV